MRPHPSIQPIPQEIIHYIIQKLATDKAALRIASSVSSSFRQPCQKLLFSHLTLKPPEISRYAPCEDLVDLLKGSPIIGSYFKSIRIEDTPYHNDELRTGPSLWLTHHKSFAEAFNLIHTAGIQKFSLFANSFASINDRYWWYSLPPRSRQVITRIMQSPALVHFEAHLPAPLAIHLCCGTTVRRLDVISGIGSVAHPGFSERNNEGGGVHLETIALSGCWGIRTLFLCLLQGNDGDQKSEGEGHNCFVDLKAVKKLKACIPSGQIYEYLAALVLECHSLQVFAIDTPFEQGDSHAQHMDFSKCPDLRKIFVRGPRLRGEGQVSDIVKVAAVHLRGVPTANLVEDVHLFFLHSLVGWSSALEKNIIHKLCRQGPWATLDEILSDKDRFPMLKRVRVDLTTTGLRDGDDEDTTDEGVPDAAMNELLRRTEELLPNLKQKGLLELSIVIEEEGVEYGPI
ncbi:hypothetical protein FA15DRAFT_659024 [Coprinopsis marcescibilis]|uniref:F-box domain-containing protein n=1 Tax=Coprinopsis marcescibilis TaxID=230819 RepID=A0A5C3KJN9_COPMA|nr:hypothetical protein FA15DRAFT_659024 [Coprinopsis marcescibilis]